jgi:23S rRNA (guanosine2251-2'-O)-methyltransferase
MDVLYGLHPVAECLKAGRRKVHKIWVADKDRLAELGLLLGRPPSPAPEFTTKDACARKAGTPHHQGVMAEVGEYPYADWADLLAPDPVPLVVVLDNLTDPQNVGAILRSALCAGATGVTLRKHHAAQITPAVVKASAGASERMPVGLVPNQSMFLEQAAEAGLARVALAMDGDPLWSAAVDWAGPLALVVGAEGKGLSRLVAEHCDLAVRIPMRGGFDSLNASVAASLALFEAARHRR